MIVYTRTNVLLPKSILCQQDKLSEQKFTSIVRKYLLRYPNYQFNFVKGSFAVCDRADEVKERRKKR